MCVFSHTSVFIVQCAVSSEIQGLLGRQPCMMGSWFRYCSLYFTKLHIHKCSGIHTHTHAQEDTHSIIVLVLQIIRVNGQ